MPYCPYCKRIHEIQTSGCELNPLLTTKDIVCDSELTNDGKVELLTEAFKRKFQREICPTCKLQIKQYWEQYGCGTQELVHIPINQWNLFWDSQCANCESCEIYNECELENTGTADILCLKCADIGRSNPTLDSPDGNECDCAKIGTDNQGTCQHCTLFRDFKRKEQKRNYI